MDIVDIPIGCIACTHWRAAAFSLQDAGYSKQEEITQLKQRIAELEARQRHIADVIAGTVHYCKPIDDSSEEVMHYGGQCLQELQVIAAEIADEQALNREEG